MIPDEKLDELKAKYGKVWTFDVGESDEEPAATLAFRKPTLAECEGYESKILEDKSQMPQRRRRFVLSMVVYPDAKTVMGLFEEYPGLPVMIFGELDLIIAQRKSDKAKKA